MSLEERENIHGRRLTPSFTVPTLNANHDRVYHNVNFTANLGTATPKHVSISIKALSPGNWVITRNGSYHTMLERDIQCLYSTNCAHGPGH